MTTLEEWQTRNEAYLSAALEWLRATLEQAVPRVDTTSTSPSQAVAAAAPAEPPKRGFFRRSVPELPTPVEVPRLPSPEAMDARPLTVEAARARLVEASQGEPPPALLMLAKRLGLSDFERDILLLAVAMELDPACPSLLARIQDSNTRAFPTFGLAMSVFDNAAWEALSPERPLRYWRLLEINQPGAQPLTASALRADERIVSFVKGLNYLDDRLTTLIAPLESCMLEELPGTQRAVAARAIASLAPGTEARGPLMLIGRDAQSKRSVAAAICGALGLHLYQLSADLLPMHSGELETLARLWQRETMLSPLALLLDAQELDKLASTATPESPAQRLVRFVARTGGLLFVSSRDGLACPIESTLTLEVSKPMSAEQGVLWSTLLRETPPGLPARLAGQFDLNYHDIASIVDQANKGDTAEPLQARVWRGCRERTRPTIEKLAMKIDARATWDDIVLPSTETALLHQIADQVGSRAMVYDDWGFRARMNRGLGISALFAGESGTGKTMAAEVLANALELDLYRIDLSAVVNKYIGETEKNLRQVFDGAEGSGAILLFDEADALFGKRSEVKDSHDRYANIEINYLLQRMEAYRGLAILATNMKSALDTAFMRRLRFIIKFPFPAASERRRMWERAFPAGAPLGTLDFARLSRLGVTGGTIHNIALNSAFAAARAGSPVTMSVVLDAARTEFRKTDRPVNEADFQSVETPEVRV